MNETGTNHHDEAIPDEERTLSDIRDLLTLLDDDKKQRFLDAWATRQGDRHREEIRERTGESDPRVIQDEALRHAGSERLKMVTYLGNPTQGNLDKCLEDFADNDAKYTDAFEIFRGIVAKISLPSSTNPES